MPIRDAPTEAGTAAENRGAALPVATLDRAGDAVPAAAALAAYEAGQRLPVTAALGLVLARLPKLQAPPLVTDSDASRARRR